MKTFRDSSDISWTVFEVRRQITSRREGNLLPSGFSDGWLCFEAVGQKRRLVRYPTQWRELPAARGFELIGQRGPERRPRFAAGD